MDERGNDALRDEMAGLIDAVDRLSAAVLDMLSNHEQPVARPSARFDIVPPISRSA